jgi:hypothetical protein
MEATVTNVTGCDLFVMIGCIVVTKQRTNHARMKDQSLAWEHIMVDGFTILILLALVMSAVVLERRAGNAR